MWYPVELFCYCSVVYCGAVESGVVHCSVVEYTAVWPLLCTLRGGAHYYIRYCVVECSVLCGASNTLVYIEGVVLYCKGVVQNTTLYW